MSKGHTGSREPVAQTDTLPASTAERTARPPPMRNKGISNTDARMRTGRYVDPHGWRPENALKPSQNPFLDGVEHHSMKTILERVCFRWPGQMASEPNKQCLSDVMWAPDGARRGGEGRGHPPE
jgi:hypothetical protein